MAKSIENTEKDQDEVVRDREQPLENRHPAIEIVFHVRIIDSQVHGLLFNGGGVLVREQSCVGADPGLETGQLGREVKPPARITLSKENHQGRG